MLIDPFKILKIDKEQTKKQDIQVIRKPVTSMESQSPQSAPKPIKVTIKMLEVCEQSEILQSEILQTTPDKEVPIVVDVEVNEEKKRTRPDRAAKRRNYNRTSVVKCRLNTFINNNGRKNGLSEKLRDAVLTINDIAFGAYHLVNIYLLDLCENDPSKIPKSLSQTFFSQACGYVGSLGPGWGPPLRKKKKELIPMEIVQKYRDSLPTNYVPPRRNNLTDLISNLARQMVVVAKNHINTNFDQRLSTYIRDAYGIKDLWHRKYIINRIFGRTEKNPKSKFQNAKTDSIVSAFKVELKNPRKGTDISKRLDIYLPFLWKIKKFQEIKRKGIEALNDEARKGKKVGKSFRLMPLKSSLIPSHISICSDSLAGILHCKADNATNKGLWDKYFKVSTYTTRNRKFGNSISTNGYEVSIRFDAPGTCSHSHIKTYISRTALNPDREFEKCSNCDIFLGFTDTKAPSVSSDQNDGDDAIPDDPQKIPEMEDVVDELIAILEDTSPLEGLTQQDLDKIRKDLKIGELTADQIKPFLKYMDMAGLDPGWKSLFTATHSDGRTTRCGKKYYKHLTGQRKQTKQINARKDRLGIAAKYHGVSFTRPTCVDDYLESLKKEYELKPEGDKEYRKLYYRKKRFTAYLKKQKAFRTLAKTFVSSKKLNKGEKASKNKFFRTYIGYGSGARSNNSPIRGGRMPVKGFRNYLKTQFYKHVRVIDIDEFRTTIMCNGCGIKTHDAFEWKEIGEGEDKKHIKAKIYGLRRCKSNCSITWDRDVNGSRNILLLLQHLLLGLKRPLYLSRPPKKEKNKTTKQAVKKGTSPQRETDIVLTRVTPLIVERIPCITGSGSFVDLQTTDGCSGVHDPDLGSVWGQLLH